MQITDTDIAKGLGLTDRQVLTAMANNPYFWIEAFRDAFPDLWEHACIVAAGIKQIEAQQLQNPSPLEHLNRVLGTRLQ